MIFPAEKPVGCFVCTNILQYQSAAKGTECSKHVHGQILSCTRLLFIAP